MNINERLSQEFRRLTAVEKEYLLHRGLPARPVKVFEADHNDDDFMNEFRRLQDIEQHFLNLQQHASHVAGRAT